MDETTTNRKEIERRYWIHFEILKLVWTQGGGGDLTGFGGVSMVVGNHGMVEKGHLASSITFDYKGSRDIQIYHQRAALL